MSSEISEVVSGQVNERFLEVPTNSTYFADLATLNAAQSGAQNPFDAVVREVVDLRAADGDMSAFDSRYKPLASDSLWIPASEMIAVGGSPVVGTLGNASTGANRTGVMLFDAATTETVTATFRMPPSWAGYEAVLWWSNAGAGAGDVRWFHGRLAMSDTTDTDAGGTQASLTETAPAQYVLTRTTLVASTTHATAGQVVRWLVGRLGGEAVDTLANDVGVLGLEIVRTS